MKIPMSAIRLLRKVKKKALMGANNHTVLNCPIAMGYGVGVIGIWEDMEEDDAKKLKSHGWNKRNYEAFVRWFDATDLNETEEQQASREAKFKELLK